MDRSEAATIALAGGEPARALVVRLLDALDQVTAAVEEVAALRERVLELERELNRTSRNSSVAPSSDPPLTRQERRQIARERAKKQLQREGRQAARAGVPEVREWRRLRLECPNCGKPALAELPADVSLSTFGPRLHMSRSSQVCAASLARRSSSCSASATGSS